MGKPVLDVQGAKQLRAALKAAGIGVQDLKDAHRAVAELVTTDARVKVPVRSGRLAAAIRPGVTQGQALIRAGGARVPYAGPIHWGWPARHIRPQTFLTDAAEATRPKWESEYLAALDAIIDRIERDT